MQGLASAPRASSKISLTTLVVTDILTTGVISVLDPGALMAKNRESLGIQELALLRYIAQKGPVSVRDITNEYGVERGLARSTILTMVERLREKKRLKRSRSEGVYRYVTSVPSSELLRDVVRNFVDTALDGSFSPFVNYLADEPNVSDKDLAELERIVARLQARKKESP
jgi:predicted transcriptional regulator